MTLNGIAAPAPEGTLLEYLVQEGYNPQHVVVEVNRQIFNHTAFANVHLQDSDDVNILQFMGGG